MENIWQNFINGKPVVNAGVNVEITNDTLLRLAIAMLLLAFIIILMIKFI